MKALVLVWKKFVTWAAVAKPRLNCSVVTVNTNASSPVAREENVFVPAVQVPAT